MAFGNVVSLQSPNSIIDLWREYCEARGLTEEVLAPLGGSLMPLGNPLKEKLGTAIWGFTAFGVVGAYVYELAPGEWRGRMVFDPQRQDQTPKPGETAPRKPGTKYLVPANATNLLYVPTSIADWTTAEYDLYIVEGVLNALKLSSAGIHAVGIPGVHNYHIGKKNSPIIPELVRMVQLDNVKRVIVMFDSDAGDPETNPKVWNANNVFVQDMMKLRKQRRDTIYVCNPPARADGSKNGPDDFLHTQGINQFNALINSSECRRYEDDPYFQLESRVVNRFIYDASSGQVWDEKIRGLCDKSHANLNMATEGSAIDITSTRPQVVTFNIDRLLQAGGRRVAEGMAYNPSTDDSYFLDEDATPPVWRINKFNPQDVPEAVKGDVSLALRAIDNICADSPSAVQKLLTIVAYHAQNPALTPKYAPLFVGDKGSGKSNLAKLIGLSLSKRFHDTRVRMGDSKDFNSEWRGYACKEWPEYDPEMDEEELKALITSPSYIVNTKYGRMYTERNHTLNIFTSNTLQSRIQEGDRRFLICGDAKARDKEFGLEFERWVGGLGPNYFRHFLLEYDATGYHTLDVWTEMRDEVIDASKSYKATIKDLLIEEFNEVEGLECVPNDVIAAKLVPHRVNLISFIKENGHYFVKPAREMVKINGSVMRFRAFKNLDKWRKETNGEAYREQFELAAKLKLGSKY